MTAQLHTHSATLLQALSPTGEDGDPQKKGAEEPAAPPPWSSGLGMAWACLTGCVGKDRHSPQRCGGHWEPPEGTHKGNVRAGSSPHH